MSEQEGGKALPASPEKYLFRSDRDTPYLGGGNAEQTTGRRSKRAGGRATRGREQDFAEINRRMYEEIRSSRDPRDNMEDG